MTKQARLLQQLFKICNIHGVTIHLRHMKDLDIKMCSSAVQSELNSNLGNKQPAAALASPFSRDSEVLVSTGL